MPGPAQRSPSVGSMSPVRSRASTVFPAPLGPTIPTRSPRMIVSETSMRTGSKSTPRSSITRSPPRAPARSASAIWRRSNTGRSTLSMRSIRQLGVAGALDVALVDDAVRPVLEAPDRLLEAGDLLLLGDVLLPAADQLDLVGDGVGGVVARPHADAPVLELGDLRDGLVEQVPVVGDDEHGALEVAYELLDDPAALDVEVRLRLVEQQDVGPEDEARGERDELALAAAQRGHRALEVAVGEAELAQMADRVALEAVGPGRLPLLEQARVALEHALHPVEVARERGVRELRLAAREVGLERREVRPGVADRPAHAALVAADQLREVRDDRAAAQGHRAGVGLVASREQAQERRLAGAVGADQPDAGAGGQLEVEAVEDPPAAERLHDAAGAERGGGGRGADGHPRHRNAGAVASFVVVPPAHPDAHGSAADLRLAVSSTLEMPGAFLRVCVLARRSRRPPKDATTCRTNH